MILTGSYPGRRRKPNDLERTQHDAVCIKKKFSSRKTSLLAVQGEMSKLAGVGDAGSGGSAPPAGSPRVMVSLCYRTDILVTIKMLGYGDEQDVGGDAQGRQVDNGGGGRWLLAARHCDGAVRRGVGTTASGDWRVWATHWSAGVGGPAVARVPYYYLIGKNAT
jgi:hypothetical protein